MGTAATAYADPFFVVVSSIPMIRPRLLAFLTWLVLALAMGPQAAFVHDLGHALGNQASHQQDSQTAPATCDDCGHLAGLALGLVAKTFTAPLIVAASPRSAAIRARDAQLAPLYAYRSQAPPAALA